MACFFAAFVIRHPAFVIRHPAFVIRHFSFPIPRSAFRIPHSAFRIPHSAECREERGLRDVAAVKIAQGTRRVLCSTLKGAT